jgi:hypothetical protein
MIILVHMRSPISRQNNSCSTAGSRISTMLSADDINWNEEWRLWPPLSLMQCENKAEVNVNPQPCPLWQNAKIKRNWIWISNLAHFNKFKKEYSQLNASVESSTTAYNSICTPPPPPIYARSPCQLGFLLSITNICRMFIQEFLHC